MIIWKLSVIFNSECSRTVSRPGFVQMCSHKGIFRGASSLFFVNTAKTMMTKKAYQNIWQWRDEGKRQRFVWHFFFPISSPRLNVSDALQYRQLLPLYQLYLNCIVLIVLVFILFSHGYSAILAAKLMIKLDLTTRVLLMSLLIGIVYIFEHPLSGVLYNFGSFCLSVCFYVCHTITFQSLDIGSSYSHIQFISSQYGLDSYMKVIGSRLRSQEPERSKIPIPAM